MAERGGLVDWGLAERTATAVASVGRPGRAGYGEEAIRAACERAIEDAAAYARLPVPEDWPRPELVDRAEWSRNALATLAAAARPIEERFAERSGLPGPLGSVLRKVIGAGAGAELGVVVGYVARHVIGQYDVAVVGAERPARLLFVGPNVEAVRAELAADRELFLRWISLHETTHVLQFESVPWLPSHLRALLGELLESAGRGVDGERLAGLGKRLVRAPRELVRELLRGEFARLVADPRQQELVDRLQATMAVIEGHAEHVMDACAAEDPRLAELRVGLDERRGRRGGLGEIVARLIGMDLKVRQYELGKRFWDEILAERGPQALEDVWAAAERLPDLAELENPSAWLERTSLTGSAR